MTGILHKSWRYYLIPLDSFLSTLALYLVGLLRFEAFNPFRWAPHSEMYTTIIPFAVVGLTGAVIFPISGLYRNLRIYTSLEEFIYIARASILNTLLLAAFSVLTPGNFFTTPGVITLYFVMLLLLLGLRDYGPAISSYINLRRRAHKGRKVLLIGAGIGGSRVCNEFQSHHELRRNPAGFIDDDPSKIGGQIHGVPVLGTVDEIDNILSIIKFEEVVITTRLPSGKLRKIHRSCEKRGVACHTLPTLSEMLKKSPGRQDLEEISLEDLLGREVVRLETDGIRKTLKDRTILITGAGGSIGSEVCRQLIQFEPAAMILLDNAETPLYEIDYELRNNTGHENRIPARVLSIIGDIRNTETLDQIFRNHDIHVVFHCAAYKHVPMMELNPGEAVMNNIVGTRNIADASRNYGVERFVMISTDKAVNPVNVMGATKRIAELYIQNLARSCDTKFITVRFGNVLGSSGSVIPLFKKQIARGGPVTVTHPDIIRYFMTIEEAAGLVIQAGVMGQEGEIFILDMGEPVRIKDLAEDMIRLAGYEPHKDIEIHYIGLRPGEKLFEELLLAEEGVQPTRHKKIHIATSRFMNLNTLTEKISLIEKVADNCSRRTADSIIASILPEYRPVYVVGDTSLHASPRRPDNGKTDELTIPAFQGPAPEITNDEISPGQ